jgi:cardiolipin synthase
MQKHQHSECVGEELLITPSSIFGRLIADVQRARESIDMEYYIFSEDRIGRVFAELLCRKARQGLRVRLLVDGFGSRRMSKHQRRRLLAAGVDVRSCRFVGYRRNHRKMAIIDSRIAHIGGVNIADRYVAGDALGPWHDVQLRFVGGGVSALVLLFDYDFFVAEGLKCEVPMCYVSPRLRLVWSESCGRRAMPQLFAEVMASARHSVVLVTPYFMPSKSVMKCLRDAVRRGVAVRLLVPQRCGMWLLDDVMRHYVNEARMLGVDVCLCRDMFLHAKLAVVDGCSVVVGSANLDQRSMSINRELMALTTCRDVVASAEEFVRSMMLSAVRPTAADLRTTIPRCLVRIVEPWL